MSQANPNETFSIESPPQPSRGSSPIVMLLKPLASLKLTVALFAVSIFLVLAGTLAQVNQDIWDVVREYFRCWRTWIEVKSFAPLINPLTGLFVDHSVEGGSWLDLSKVPSYIKFPFPGGNTIGALMLINLLAAHSLRFTVQAKGARAIAGSIVTAIGVLVTWMVIQTGHADTSVQDAWIDWDVLWWLVEGALFVLGGVTAVAAFKAQAERKPEFVPLLISCVFAVTALAVMFVQGGRGIDDSGMRILWQLIKGVFAGGVLLAGCTLLFKKRAGVVVLHGGVILMLIHEPIVGTLHIETQMSIEEGKTANYAEDIRTVELALTDGSNSEFDEVVSIPKQLLTKAADSKTAISSLELPFDIEVVKFLQNSTPTEIKSDADNPATAGVGLSVATEDVAAGTGTDSGGAVDLTSAYVKLIDKQSRQPLGTYLVGVYFSLASRPEWHPNRIVHDGKTWDLSLRFKRHYKSYSVTLKDVSKTDYAGTGTPRDYRSIIQLVDVANNTDFEKHIWMNNPLRYAGETFYQTNYSKDERTGKEKTTLSVVKNTGWMIPYVSCMIVAVGMLAHFWSILVRFVQRRFGNDPVALRGLLEALLKAFGFRDEIPTVRLLTKVDPEGSSFVKYLPWAVAIIAGLYVSNKAREPKPPVNEPDYVAFGKIPVLYEGRLQPIDTLAQNSLKILSGYSTFKDENGVAQPATRWLLDVIANPGEAARHQVVKIDHPELRRKLGLEPLRIQLGVVVEESAPPADKLNGDGKAKTAAGAKVLSVSPHHPASDAQVLAGDVITKFNKEVVIDSDHLKSLVGNAPTGRPLGLEVMRGGAPTALSVVLRTGHRGHRYALVDFLSELPKIAKEAHKAREKQSKFRSADERKILEFERKIGMLDLLTRTFSPTDLNEGSLEQDVPAASRELDMLDDREPPLAIPPFEAEGNKLISSEKWQTFARGWTTSYLSVNVVHAQPCKPAAYLTEILVAHTRHRRAVLDFDAAALELKQNKAGDKAKLTQIVQEKADLAVKAANEFNDDVASYRSWLEPHLTMLSKKIVEQQESVARKTQGVEKEISAAADPKQADELRAKLEALKKEASDLQLRAREVQPDKPSLEASFNSFSPFYWAMQNYLVALLMALCGLVGFSRPLNRASFLTILVTLVVHSYAIYARYEISGKPPVTNLYSSAVFIGWGAVVLSVLFEGVYRLGIGNLIGASLGAASLGIAHLLSGDGDTMKVMQAVLDTQFWLWTHVTCITLGYAVTFVAGTCGMLYVICGLFTTKLTPAFGKDLVRIVYGTICFGIFFSFVGTVLGGLWADDSWGRFWGWDPKENGALIIVLWNALVLHARWDGMVKERGLCVLAIMGNVVTSWSWFGVNELGVGLHSYGFTEGVWMALWTFWLTQFALVGAGCISTSKWRSFQAHGRATTEIA